MASSPDARGHWEDDRQLARLGERDVTPLPMRQCPTVILEQPPDVGECGLYRLAAQTLKELLTARHRPRVIVLYMVLAVIVGDGRNHGSLFPRSLREAILRAV